MAHGAMPFEGKNPNRAAAAAIAALAVLERDVQAAHGAHPHLGQVWITPTVLRAQLPDDSADWAAELTAQRDEAIAALSQLS